MKLNPQQQRAVLHIDGPLLVLAGAGSGKTGVITRKIAHLLDQGIKPHNIIAVTFTNKAAQEMKKRVSKLTRSQKTKGLTISTFHTLGLNFIREEISYYNLKPNFSIFDQEDAISLIRDIAAQSYSDNDKLKFYQHQISQWKNGLITPAQAMQEAQNPLETAAAALYEQYESHLRAYNGVDFDDLIKLPVQCLQEHAEVRERWQNRIRHFLVDECQDTNVAQYELIKHLVGRLGHFTVVGDDDQSIYAWRGARPDNLVKLQEDYPRMEVIKLEQNYRSTQLILDAANKLIANNPHVFEKKLWSDRGAGDKIRVMICKEEEDEGRQVVLDIIRHRMQHGGKYSQYAILYRGNHQSRVFERMLREYQVPYQITGGQSFFARAEVKDIMAYLKLMANPDDDRAFLRIVNTPKREIGASTLEKLASYAHSRQKSLLVASLEMGLGELLPPRNLKALQRFANHIILIADCAQRGDTLGVLRDFIRDIGYETYLYDTQTTPKAAEKRMENVWELINWISRLLENEEEKLSFTDIVAKLALYDMLEREGEDKQQDAVQLMTLHAAKGLEFPSVYLVGAEENLLPHRTSIEEDNIEEERRLAYVGITRAQQYLTISYCSKRKQHGDTVDCVPSRFLREVGTQYLDWPGQSKPCIEESQAKARNHLDSLRGLLSAD